MLDHTRHALGDPVLLAGWTDVDSIEELRALARRLASRPERAPAVSAWMRHHGIGLEVPD